MDQRKLKKEQGKTGGRLSDVLSERDIKEALENRQMQIFLYSGDEGQVKAISQIGLYDTLMKNLTQKDLENMKRMSSEEDMLKLIKEQFISNL